ncbi:hypothetical protein [Roseovarius aestuarii]|uniref:Uncharacterized protein n=1 Tax=Roseovarius aestuarii TaxID=475083 RepID=A0A1X7BWZ4_9RHOB|nr:hypothetical protein [Roseovarius aestuarii]SMC14177.1 hypothetical protein ROA7745_04042 [Roseovarius aestuarii]
MKFSTPILKATAAMAITLCASPLLAGDMPTAQEIADAVSDHTYQGSMSAGGSGFSEYYAADGTIRGVDYTGKWRTEDGVMCFNYGQDDRCFGITLDGPSMVMYKDDKIDGNGMLIKGNPQDF